MLIRDYRPAIIFVFLFLTVAVFPTHGKEPLDRLFAPLQLGMTLKAFQQAVSSTESREAYLSLLSGERFFKVADEVLPEGLASLSARFYHGRLYKILAAYIPDGLSEENWSEMVDQKMRQYGKIPIQRRPIRERMLEISRWEDDATVYILQREIRMRRFKDKKPGNSFTVSITYLDKPLWDQRVAAESKFLF